MQHFLSNKEKLKKIEKDILECQRCPLFKTRRKPVPGEGNPEAKLFLIGEAPGASEDKTGRPFCGRAGKILEELLKIVGLKREKVFIGNVLKCRPPGNRNPKVEEIQKCTPFLDAQLKIIKPKIICTLGNYSTSYIMERFGLKSTPRGISKIHGKIFKARSSFGLVNPVRNLISNGVKIIPLYHPAVTTYNPRLKKVLEKDFKILKRLKKLKKK